MRDLYLYDPAKEAMALCKLNPEDAAWWQRGRLCPHHQAMEDGMMAVLEWLEGDDDA